MSLNLEALETSFDLVAPRGDQLMDEFYARLFAAAPAVRALFPAQPEHYPVVGAALIASMAEVAGDAWTCDYEAAWGAAAFEIVAAAMLAGAEEAALDAAA
jgi:hemoglobin-like flavoprotein